MRRLQPTMPAKPKVEQLTYDVLKSFWHNGRLISSEDPAIKKDGLTMSEAKAKFLVLNGTLKLRPTAKPKSGKADA